MLWHIRIIRKLLSVLLRLSCLMEDYDFHFKTCVPFAPVRAFTVFAGPVPPELTADTFIIYMV